MANNYPNSYIPPIPLSDPPVPVNLPYMAWNRIEARPRKRQFDRVLKAEVHDALWMLGKQWQVGEFKGNDTGSGILAKMQLDYLKMNAFKLKDSNTVPYNYEMPIEPIVERLNYSFSMKESVLMGRKFLQMLEQTLSSVNNSLYQSIKSAITNINNGLTVIETIPEQSNANSFTEQEILNKAERFSDKKVFNFYSAIRISNSVINGAKIYQDLKSISNSAGLTYLGNTYGIYTPSGLTPSEITAISTSIGYFKSWVEKMYSLPQGGNADEAWNPRSLSYSFETHFPKGGADKYVLKSDDYAQGKLDWFAFSQLNDTSNEPSVVEMKTLQVIMSEARFAGMPSSRWWEFENGGVNFSDIDANTTDIAKILMTQFSLIYQDDWFVVPMKLPIGSYSNLRGIVVTDVFGVRTYISNYSLKYNGQGQFIPETSWNGWRWMDISIDDNVINSSRPTGNVLLPPVARKSIESEPIEQVVFIRDEMSNLVWAIEKIVPDHLGKGTDGNEKANAFKKFIANVKPTVTATANIPEEDAKLQYKLVDAEIPENWIPFQPTHIGGTAIKNRKIRLQRSAMPRILPPYVVSLVRPRTSILKYGFGSTPSHYFINEEEVPKSGCIVDTTFQRTRWYNGKIVTWVGRSKKNGRGEGSSGLVYDKVDNIDGQ